MAWVNWSRRADVASDAARSIGIDLNSSCARAAWVAAGRPPRRLTLDDPHDELPLALSLEKRTPEVGRPGLTLCRKLPHLSVSDFLAALGRPREWRAGRHRLDAAAATGLVLERLRPACGEAETVALVLPAYLTTAQVTQLTNLAVKARLPVRGSTTVPLALAATADRTWHSTALVVDADDHALSGAVVGSDDAQVRALAAVALPRLSLRVWKERLLDALADRCIRLCRRDPRDSAVTEQALYEQLDDALERAGHGQTIDLTVRSSHWYQNLVHQPDDFDGFCAALAQQAVAGLRQLWMSASEPPGVVWVTYPAARLPGLLAALHQHLPERTEVVALAVDAVAGAAATVADRMVRGELPRLHLDTSVPLPPANGGDVIPLRRAAGGPPPNTAVRGRPPAP